MPVLWVPRQWQQETLEEHSDNRRRGKRGGLTALAAGLGKTWVMAKDAESVMQQSGGRGIILSHRADLTLQHAVDFAEILGLRPDQVGINTGEVRYNLDAEYLFATFQSQGFIMRQTRKDEFAFVGVDEAHHSAAPWFRQVVGYYQPAYRHGASGTWIRYDGEPIYPWFGRPLNPIDLATALAREYLTPLRYVMVTDEMARNGEAAVSGGFSDLRTMTIKDINTRYFLQERDEVIWEDAFNRISQVTNPRVIAFMASVAHAERFADAFPDARAIHYNLDNKSAEIQAFRDGEYNVAATVELFTEGLNFVDVNVLLFQHNGVSPVKWGQQLGRGTRRVEGKDELLAVDYLANIERMRMVQALMERTRAIAEREQRARSRRRVDGVTRVVSGGLTTELDETIIDLLQTLEQRAKKWTRDEILRAASAELVYLEAHPDEKLVPVHKRGKLTQHAAVRDGVLTSAGIDQGFGAERLPGLDVFRSRFGSIPEFQVDLAAHLGITLPRKFTSRQEMIDAAVALTRRIEAGEAPDTYSVQENETTYERPTLESGLLTRSGLVMGSESGDAPLYSVVLREFGDMTSFRREMAVPLGVEPPSVVDSPAAFVKLAVKEVRYVLAHPDEQTVPSLSRRSQGDTAPALRDGLLTRAGIAAGYRAGRLPISEQAVQSLFASVGTSDDPMYEFHKMLAVELNVTPPPRRWRNLTRAQAVAAGVKVIEHFERAGPRRRGDGPAPLNNGVPTKAGIAEANVLGLSPTVEQIISLYKDEPVGRRALMGFQADVAAARGIAYRPRFLNLTRAQAVGMAVAEMQWIRSDPHSNRFIPAPNIGVRDTRGHDSFVNGFLSDAAMVRAGKRGVMARRKSIENLYAEQAAAEGVHWIDVYRREVDAELAKQDTSVAQIVAETIEISDRDLGEGGAGLAGRTPSPLSTPDGSGAAAPTGDVDVAAQPGPVPDDVDTGTTLDPGADRRREVDSLVDALSTAVPVAARALRAAIGVDPHTDDARASAVFLDAVATRHQPEAEDGVDTLRVLVARADHIEALVGRSSEDVAGKMFGELLGSEDGRRAATVMPSLTEAAANVAGVDAPTTPADPRLAQRRAEFATRALPAAAEQARRLDRTVEAIADVAISDEGRSAAAAASAVLGEDDAVSRVVTHAGRGERFASSSAKSMSVFCDARAAKPDVLERARTITRSTPPTADDPVAMVEDRIQAAEVAAVLGHDHVVDQISRDVERRTSALEPQHFPSPENDRLEASLRRASVGVAPDASLHQRVTNEMARQHETSQHSPASVGALDGAAGTASTLQRPASTSRDRGPAGIRLSPVGAGAGTARR